MPAPPSGLCLGALPSGAAFAQARLRCAARGGWGLGSLTLDPELRSLCAQEAQLVHITGELATVKYTMQQLYDTVVPGRIPEVLRQFALAPPEQPAPPQPAPQPPCPHPHAHPPHQARRAPAHACAHARGSLAGTVAAPRCRAGAWQPAAAP